LSAKLQVKPFGAAQGKPEGKYDSLKSLAKSAKIVK
jgi:hypothetical protein